MNPDQNNNIPPQTVNSNPEPEVSLDELKAKKWHSIKVLFYILLGCIACLVIYFNESSLVYNSNNPILSILLGFLAMIGTYGTFISFAVLIITLLKSPKAFNPKNQPDYRSQEYKNSRIALLRNGLIIYVILAIAGFIVNPIILFFGIYMLIFGFTTFIMAIELFVRKQPKIAGMYLLACFAIFIVGFGICTAGFSGLGL